MLLSMLLPLVIAAQAPEGDVTIRTEHLRVMMSGKAGWTVRTVDYDGTQMVVDAGGQGAVYQPSGGEWVGSAMQGGEQVSDFSITVDGEAAQIIDGGLLTGQTVTTLKTSTIGKMAHTAETTVGADAIIHRHTFTATDDISLASFYAFIYSVAPTTTDWLVRGLDGEESNGLFRGDGGYAVDTNAEWAAQYNSARGKGLICYYITRFDGTGTTRIWDQKTYHKFFGQPLTGQMPKGTTVEYQMVMQFFSAEADAWHDAARQHAAALEQQYPPQRAAAVERPRLYGEGVPESGLLSVRVGEHAVDFSAEQAWTIRSITIDGNPIGGATGFYGTVLVPRGGNWIGTGHTEGGREIVHSISLIVDGSEQPVTVDTTIEADEVTLIKDSTIHEFRARTTVTVGRDDIYQRQELEAVGDMGITLMYLFMHCWSHTTTNWLAELPDGETMQGELSEKGFEINRDTRWIAEYEPNWSMAIIGYTPRVAAGPGSATRIWVVPDRYNKHYTQRVAGNGEQFAAGDRLDYEMIVRGVKAETRDWQRTLQAAGMLKQKYPPVE